MQGSTHPVPLFHGSVRGSERLLLYVTFFVARHTAEIPRSHDPIKIARQIQANDLVRS